ncbi:MAG: uracil-DNA glycosylase [Planctomycetaceae bacterium]
MDLETLRRTLVQRLESDRRFGVTHLPPAHGAFDLSFLDDVGEPPAATPSRVAEVAKTAPVGLAAKSSGAAKTMFDAVVETVIPTGENITPPNTEPSTVSREERIRQLSIIETKVSACTRCAELAATRHKTVFGTGDPSAALFFLGEAPGADEDRVGEPFVGRAGQLLDKIIAACRLKREDVYIGNILKCRPPGNRNPAPQEAANCREYLSAQLAIVDPDYIVCWGKVAVENLLGTKEPVGRLRKKFQRYGRAKVAVTYHPSYLLRNPAAKKDVWDDMKWLFRDMGVEL